MSEEASFETPTPDPALRRLDFLVGSWDVKGSTIEGPMGPAGETEWMEGGFFLVPGDSLVVTGPARIRRTSSSDGTIRVDSKVPVGPDAWTPMMSYVLTRNG
ncbi:hypothetical protein GCM10009678_00900 [Actinomadura kijaniata]|uniref:DUF1579 domain-containing protein n=2 Tax=Actinomadura TaxID=1988 RepID=A0A7W3QN84_ACTNM|nr:hypothetical protein [Actinomadura namibiensis]MBA8953382.1 hypothetical protein [Actinomadura namibiensis]